MTETRGHGPTLRGVDGGQRCARVAEMVGPPGVHSDVVFNVVWTGEVFTYLKYFVCSLIHHSEARFRFVGNGCTPASLAEMASFADEHPDAVVEVLDVSPDRMVAHGQALDAVLACRDDGDLFCAVDPDIRASGPFLEPFIDALRSHAAVTSGREVWNDDNTVPDGHPGVGGRHFFDTRGFVFGSPHLAFYRRAPLVETMDRWGVGLGSAGPELSDAARGALADLGHAYRVYDTAKIVNILLQADGHAICHLEHPALLHIGGMSHYLAPSHHLDAEPGQERRPDWARHENVQARFEVARFTATVLRAVADGEEAPDVPAGLAPDLSARLHRVREAVTDLVGAHAPC